uniref:Galectin n=1 Tax=Phallusia mammillata TaxID=59560 RepID=A0A6F9DJQ1_9ASCI|nr:galectin-9 [Phallusia mammillata]
MTTTEYIVKAVKTLGHTITVCGKPTSTRVAINLLVNDDSNNIGCHFNPRFDQKEIVLNNKVNGTWKTEQRARKGNFMWAQSSHAEYKLVVGTADITCYWNGLKLDGCTFKHRVSASTLAGFTVGGMDVSSVDIVDNNTTPAPVITPVEIKGDKFSGKTLRVVATPMANRTAINFKANDSDTNIAFHFNPRYDEKVIVRNNMVNGTWQTEERTMTVPFSWSLNQEYTYDIYVAEAYFSCVWNGVEVCRFVHRSAVAQDVGLAIVGMCVKSISSL